MTEKVEIIEIETGNSEKTLKSLKDEIKSLRKELDECNIGSDKFAKTLDELTKAQTELKNATKSSNNALEGSYDSLVQKMSELKKAWRSTADEAERSDLGSQIASINQQLKDMDESIGNYQRNVGNYGSAFDDVTLKIEGGVAKFDRWNNASRSIIGSFDLVEGGLKAIGVESEEVNSLMDKMQGAMIITNGLTSIKEGVVAFNAIRVATQTATAAQWSLNAAMSANPFGAVLIAVTALTTAVIAIGTALSNARDSAGELKEINDKLVESYDNLNEALEYKLRLMKADGETELTVLRTRYTELKRLRDDYYQEYLNARKTALESVRMFGSNISKQEQAELDAMYEKYLEMHDNYVKAVQDYNVAARENNRKLAEEQSKSEADKAKAAAEAAKKSKEEWLNYILELKKSYRSLLNDMEDYWKDPFELAIEKLQEQAKAEVAVLDEMLKNKEISEEEYNRKRLELNAIHIDRQNQLNDAESKKTKEAYDKRRGEFTALQESIINIQLTSSEQQLRIIEQQYEKEKQLLKSMLAEGIISYEEYNNALEGIGLKKVATENAVHETIKKETEQYGALGFKIKETGALTEDNQKKIAGSVGLVGTAFGQTGQLLSTLADKQDKETEKGFENYKKLSMAAAVMSMLQGIISSWTSAMSLPAPLSFITGGIMSGFTATLGGIQIDQIKKQSFNANSSTSSASVNIPTVNTSALLGTPINYTSEVQNASTTSEIKDTRVYVVESDISDTVSKVHITEDEATF